MTGPVPVTLLTGFLGSGKTTVLNRLLRDPAFGSTAVIVNEFGEIGLDHELVVSSSDSMVLLQSGCLCCSLRGDLLETLADLAERREAGELGFDRVAIETTGLADPAPILHTLLTSRALSDEYAVDGVVTTLDAAAGAGTLERHEEARRQAAVADLILLTKTDLPEAQEAAVRAALAELNPAAPVLKVTGGQVDPAALTGLGHFDPQMKPAAVAGWLREAAVPVPTRKGLAAQRHLDEIRAVSWVVEAPVTADQFDLWMELLMIRRGADILRLKALVHLEDVPHPFVVHGVQHIFHPPVLLKDWQGSDRRTKFVLIVRDFTDPELEELFAGLAALRVAPHGRPGGYLAAETAE
ncbi:GTP-binding protein [Poseidonocella sp. HB161398]|uniref:CobW family GTP-binding protein n=1 Tax=Poseidonocella sp. HB161398 TaxID=2320855 RepID=UPI00110843AB|nr:GTP-binding protein [Poseidonocella sp. HB161398]